MSYDLHGLLPVFLAPRDGTIVTLVGLYPRGWTQELECKWNEQSGTWEGWNLLAEPTHYLLPPNDNRSAPQ